MKVTVNKAKLRRICIGYKENGMFDSLTNCLYCGSTWFGDAQTMYNLTNPRDHGTNPHEN